MTPRERLLAEELPTGTFGGGPYTPPRTRHFVTPEDDQIQHAADLATAVSGWVWDDDPRHLPAVTTTQLPASTTETTRSAA